MELKYIYQEQIRLKKLNQLNQSEGQKQMEKIISDKYAIELIHSLSHLWLLFGLALLIFIIVCAALVARRSVPHSTRDKQANSTSNTHHDLLSELNKVQNELSAKSESFETLYA